MRLLLITNFFNGKGFQTICDHSVANIMTVDPILQHRSHICYFLFFLQLMNMGFVYTWC